MTTKPSEAFIIDKVKSDGIKVRIEYQRRREDHRYDEAAIASFDRPLPSFVAALEALWLDVCNICEFSHTYRDGLEVRGVSFSHTDGIMGAVITALKSVKAASAPVVINTPHIPSEPYGEGAGGPTLPAETIERLDELRDEAIRYINGERSQQKLDLEAPQPPDQPPGDGGVIAQARANGQTIGEALTDPNNPVLQRMAKKLKNTSITAGGRTLHIDGTGVIRRGRGARKDRQ